MEASKKEREELLLLLKEKQNNYVQLYNEMETKESNLLGLHETNNNLPKEKTDLQHLKRFIPIVDELKDRAEELLKVINQKDLGIEVLTKTHKKIWSRPRGKSKP